MPPLIRQADVTRILKGARAAGVALTIVVKGDEVRFVPSGHSSEDDERDRDLKAFQARHRPEDIDAAYRSAMRIAQELRKPRKPSLGEKFATMVAEKRGATPPRRRRSPPKRVS